MKWYVARGIPLYLTKESADLLKQYVGLDDLGETLFTPKAPTLTEAQIEEWLSTKRNGILDMDKLFEYI